MIDIIKKSGINKSDIYDVVITGGSSRIPKIQEMIETYFEKYLNKSISLDNCVVNGLAIQEMILCNANEITKNIILLESCMHSIGVGTHDNNMNVIIPQYQIIPCRKSNIFTYNNNSMIEIYEGEHTKTDHNKLIGKYKIDNLSDNLKIVIQLDLDNSCLLTVSAIDETTQKHLIIRKISNDDKHINSTNLFASIL